MTLLLVLLACDRATCPDGMVEIPGGRYRVGQEHPTRPWHEPVRDVEISSFCIDRYEYPNKKGALPKARVTWDEASALCAAEGKRLCTSDEWERACRGVDRRMFSYGRLRDAAACNTPIEGSGPGSSPAPVAPSGSFEGCASPEGVYDLNGSLSEWVADPWSGSPEPFNPGATVDEGWRTLRGGTMWSQTFYGQDCSSRHGHRRSFANMDDGLRCCQTP